MSFEKWFKNWSDHNALALVNLPPNAINLLFEEKRKVWNACEEIKNKEIETVTKLQLKEFEILESELAEAKEKMALLEKESTSYFKKEYVHMVHLHREQLDRAINAGEQIEKAEEVIRFYAEAANWFYPGKDFHYFLIAREDISPTIRVTKNLREMKTKCGGKRAREYFVSKELNKQ